MARFFSRQNFSAREIRPECVRIAFLVVLSLSITQGYADEESVSRLQRYMPQGPHRIDLSYTRVDAMEGKLDLFLVGYTAAAWANLRLGITAGIASYEVRDGSLDESGLSDTVISFQYDPTDNISASPWVPNSLGLNAALLMPTGNEEQGLGGDAWLASIGAGWAIDLFTGIWLVPAIGYETTFAEGNLAAPVERLYVDCSLVWLFPFGGWIGYTPSLAREFKTDEWVDGHTLTIGKMWLSGFGISFDVGKSGRSKRIPTRDDRNWLVNFYYQF